MRDPKLQILFAVVDPLLAVMRLDLEIVTNAFSSYKHQLHQQHDINRVFLHVEEVLIFFSPYDLESVRPVISKLVERSPTGELLIPLIDVFTLLTMFVRGDIGAKGAFLFALFNLSRQDILSETEHALMIFRMSKSLQKIGIIGKLDFSMDDIKHAAFIARYMPDRDIFVGGLNVAELTDWLTSSSVGIAASSFMAVLSRLLKVCLRMDGKASSLLLWLCDMRDHRQFDLPVPRMDFAQARLHKSDVFIVYRSNQMVSVALSTAILSPGEVYVQCNKHMKFSKTSDKFYKLISYRRAKVNRWSGHHGLYSRVDISELDADSEYSFNLYQVESNLRYPVVETRTLTDKGLPTRFETFCELYISPSCLGPGIMTEVMKSMKTVKNSTLIYTGNVCSIDEPIRRAVKFASAVAISPQPEMQPPSPPVICPTTLSAVVETHFTNNWLNGMRTLFGIISVPCSLHKDLTSVTAFDKSLIMAPCGAGHLLRSIPGASTDTQSTIRNLYMRYAEASMAPTAMIRFGSRVIFNVSAGVGNSSPVERISPLVTFLEEDNLTEESDIEEIIVLCESPRDIAIASRRFEPTAAVVLGELPVEPEHVAQEGQPVRRGKHELLHGAQYGGAEKVPLSIKMVPTMQPADGYNGSWFTYLVSSMSQWCERAYFNSNAASVAPTASPAVEDSTNSSTTAASVRKKRRLVTIVSAGWQGGCNFTFTDKSGVFATHHSLLRTKYSSALSHTVSGVVDTAASTSMGDGNILDYMRSMMPDAISVAIDYDETADRVISFSKNGVLFTACITSDTPGVDKIGYSSNLPLGNPMRKLASFCSRPPLLIVRGPQIVSLGSHSVDVCVAATGFGVVTCRIYCIPMQANHDDMVSLHIEEFKYLTSLGEINKQCLRQVKALFRFTNLKEYSAYCIVATPAASGEKHLACFKTFGGARDAVNSIMACVVPCGGLSSSRSVELAKLTKFADRSERAAVSINLMELEYSVHNEAVTSLGIRSFSDPVQLPNADIRALEQRARVTATRFTGFKHGGTSTTISYLNSVKWNGVVDICVTDQFCKLTPRDSSVESCVYGIIDALRCVTVRADLSTITILSPALYLPFSSRSGINGLWTKERSFATTHSNAVVILLEMLCRWKQGGLGGQSRDCIIFTMMDVKDVSVATIQLRPRLETNKNMQLQRQATKSSLKLGTSSKKIQLQTENTKSIAQSTYKMSSGVGTYIRNVILPARVLAADAVEHYRFATDMQQMNETLLYEFQHAHSVDSSVCVLYPRADIYGDDLLPSGEPIVYTLEVSSLCNVVSTSSEECNPDKSFHGAVVRMTVHELDNFRVTLGPVVGQVTDSTSTVIIELNSDMPLIRCQLLSSAAPPSADGELIPSFELIGKADAGKILRFDFTGLMPGLRYHVCFPDIMPNRILGSFLTQTTLDRYAQLAFVGQNVMSISIPVINNLFEAAEIYQLPNSRHNEVLNILSETGSSTASSGASSWKYLKYYLIQLQCQTSAVMHIGSHSLLAQAFSKAIKPLLNRIFNLQRVALGETLHDEIIEEQRYTDEGEPIRPTTIVQRNTVALAEVVKTSVLVSYFAEEIQLLVKEIFRALWNVPELQQVLANGSQAPLFHNDYYTPFSLESLAKLSNDVNVDMLVQAADMIQDYVRQFSQTYVLSIREIASEKNKTFEEYDSHFFVWRKASLAVLSLDLASGRLSDNNQDNDYNKEARYRATMARKMEDLSGASDSSYSPGCFDRRQWNCIKGLLVDKFITQMVICTQFPLVGLKKIPKENSFNRDDPTLVAIPFQWEPTENDLFTFFQMLIKWLDPKRSFGVSRTVILISTALVPFYTTIMDMHTGLLIHQICLPNMSATGNLRQEEKIRNEAVMFGRIKKMKYFHRFHGMDNVRLDSSRLGASRSSGTYDAADPSLCGPRSGFGILRVWFDSWKAVGDWTLCHSFPGAIEDGYSAVLTVGPVLGMLRRMTSSPSRRITDSDRELVFVPVLIEVDRVTEVVLEAVNVFSSTAITISSGLLSPFYPTVIQIGPLDINSRYSCHFVKGLMNADDHRFTIQTSSHLEEVNVAVINVDLSDGQSYCSDFIFDLVNRCSLPFNGINAVVHTNVSVSVDHIRKEFTNLPSVWHFFLNLSSVQKAKDLQAQRKEVKLTDEMTVLFSETIKRIREEYRIFFSRPSYRELLKCAHNLFMPKHNIAEINVAREKTPHYSEANYIFDLFVERVRQEYFDQLSMAPTEGTGTSIFRGLPKIILQSAEEELDEVGEEEEEEPERSLEQSVEMDRATAVALEGQVSAQNEASAPNATDNRVVTPVSPSKPKSSLFDTAGMPDEYIPLAETVARNKKIEESKIVVSPFADKVKDKNILSLPKIRYPALVYVPADLDPVEAVYKQWQGNILEPGICSLPQKWISPNNQLCIECLPPPNKDNSREVIEEYSESALDAGVRLIVLFGTAVQDIHITGGLFDPEMAPARLYGLRIQRWVNIWINEKIDRNVIIVCPSVKDGNVNLNLTLDQSPLKETERRMSAEMLGSVYISNQQEILNMKKEQQVRNKANKPKQSGNLSRARLKAIEDFKKQQDAKDLVDLTNAFKTFTPDGFILVECKHVTIDLPSHSAVEPSESRPMSKAEERKAAKEAALAASATPLFAVESRAWVRRIGSLLGGPEEEAELIATGDFNRPGATDLLQIPEWFVKCFPINGGAFIQDEVPLMMRQDPTARKLIVQLEQDSVHASLRQLYESSRLSELSRPEDQREVDMSLEGTTELLLRELGEHIYKEVLTNDLRAHMSLFSDDFIRCVCLSHAIGSSDIAIAFRSGEAFATVLQRCLILCFQMFIGYKIHALPQYSYLVSTPEFPVIESDSEPEEDDDDYMSANGDTEDKDFDESMTTDNTMSPIKKPDSVSTAEVAKAEAGDIPIEQDKVLTLKARRQTRNRFYGAKLSFLFIKQQK